MKYYITKEEVIRVDSGNGHWSYPMLNSENGCTNNCCTGISYYASTDYTPVAVHQDFQEGFVVLSGKGKVKINQEEFDVVSEMSFIVPVNTAHQMKSDNSMEPLVLFWFHAEP